MYKERTYCRMNILVKSIDKKYRHSSPPALQNVSIYLLVLVLSLICSSSISLTVTLLVLLVIIIVFHSSSYVEDIT